MDCVEVESLARSLGWRGRQAVDVHSADFPPPEKRGRVRKGVGGDWKSKCRTQERGDGKDEAGDGEIVRVGSGLG